jgi:hypothetical protein
MFSGEEGGQASPDIDEEPPPPPPSPPSKRRKLEGKLVAIRHLQITYAIRSLKSAYRIYVNI